MSRRVDDVSSAGCGAMIFGAGALAIVAMIIGLFMTGLVVEAGHVGVVTTFGKVEDGVLYPGFHLRWPFAQQIHSVDVRIQPIEFKQIDAASIEQQSVKLTGMLNYHLKADRADDIYQSVGLDFDDKVIVPALSNFLKEIVPQYAVTDILAKRDEIRTRALERLGSNLERYGIAIDDIYVADIQFGIDYQAAIEAKQTALQTAEKERQVLTQKTIQAQQRVVEATGEANAQIEKSRGDAESNKVRAAGEADAIRFKGNGQAEANRILAASINAELIRYLTVVEWDGKLPGVTGGVVPFIEVPKP